MRITAIASMDLRVNGENMGGIDPGIYRSAPNYSIGLQ
jgi:hypothetical protein